MANVLFTNVRILEGGGAAPYAGEVLVQGNRIAVEELKLDVAKFNADSRNEAGMNDVREFSNRLKARADTLSAAARAAGDQAAAALNAVHASAQVAVQGEAA